MTTDRGSWSAQWWQVTETSCCRPLRVGLRTWWGGSCATSSFAPHWRPPRLSWQQARVDPLRCGAFPGISARVTREWAIKFATDRIAAAIFAGRKAFVAVVTAPSGSGSLQGGPRLTPDGAAWLLISALGPGGGYGGGDVAGWAPAEGAAPWLTCRAPRLLAATLELAVDWLALAGAASR